MSFDIERYTFRQVARISRVSISSVWRWHLHGVGGKKLKSFKIAGRRFVTQQQLDEFFSDDSEPEGRETERDVATKKLDARGVLNPTHGEIMNKRPGRTDRKTKPSADNRDSITTDDTGESTSQQGDR